MVGETDSENMTEARHETSLDPTSKKKAFKRRSLAPCFTSNCKIPAVKSPTPLSNTQHYTPQDFWLELKSGQLANPGQRTKGSPESSPA